MSIPLKSVDLNQVGIRKHFVKEMDRGEFYVYGVQLLNMKKILTLRTEFLMVNNTLLVYEVHIRFPNKSEIKRVEQGGCLPFPQAYNKSKFQIRVAPNQEKEV